MPGSPGNTGITSTNLAGETFGGGSGAWNASRAGQSGAASQPIHQSFWVQAVAGEDLLVALKVDWIEESTEHLADDLLRVSRAA